MSLYDDGRLKLLAHAYFGDRLIIMAIFVTLYITYLLWLSFMPVLGVNPVWSLHVCRSMNVGPCRYGVAQQI